MMPARQHEPYEAPDENQHWRSWVRDTLRKERAQRIKAKTWPRSKFEAIPAPAGRVRDLHSTSMAAVYDVLEDIGRGKHNCGPRGGHPPITGETVGTYDWLAHVSIGALADLMTRIKAGKRDRWPVNTVRNSIRRLASVHSIVAFDVRCKGDRTEHNREASTFSIPHFSKVLAARRDNPVMGTSHNERDPERSLQWSNNRADSRKPLTPAQLEVWRIRELITSRGGKYDIVKPNAVATAARPGGAVPAGNRAAAVLAAVPECVKKRLSALCGENDVGPLIVAEARARAAELGKTISDEGIAELIGFIADRSPKRKLPRGGWESMVGSWSSYLLGSFTGEKGALSVAAYCDTLERRVIDAAARAEKEAEREKKAERGKQAEVRDQIRRCLKMLRKYPNDASTRDWSTSLMKEHKDLYMIIAAEDDIEWGGNGTGSSWSTPAKPRSFSDVLDATFAAQDKPPPRSA